MNKITLVLLSVLALCLGSCTQQELLPNKMNEAEVRFFTFGEVNSRVDQGPQKLAVDATVRILVFKAGDPITGSPVAQNTYKAVNGGALVESLVNPDGTVKAGSAAKLYLKEGIYDFYAITPALPTVADAVNGLKVSVGNGTDYATSKTANITISPVTQSGTTPAGSGGEVQTATLNVMERKCSQIAFSITRKTDLIKKLQLKEVKLSKMPTPSVYGVLAQDLAPVTTNTTTITMGPGLFTTGEEVSNVWTPSVGYTIILPKPSDKIDLEVKVDITSGASATATEYILRGTTTAIAFEKGKQHLFKITINGNVFELTLTVLPWDDETWKDEEVGGGSKPGTIVIGGWELPENWQDLDIGSDPKAPIIVGNWENGNTPEGWTEGELGEPGGSNPINIGSWGAGADWGANNNIG